MMNGYYGDVGWGGWLLMALVMVAFLALVVFAIALLRGNGASSNLESGHHRNPRHILDERFARGEIQLEEYRARKDALFDATQPALTRHAR